ncbi:MAG: type II toxin-antitoxin system Phd/YefM family antitoxin [Acidobacteria bacterium]|nr:type II toxin-antitoxin system Phd/YefM family antitoxin [Acidobacteriota bacterium]
MAVKVNPTQLRKNLYALLDRVIETGEPVEIERRGVTLQITPRANLSKLENARLMARPDVWAGDPDDIFNLDHLEEWREEWGLTRDETAGER